MIDKSFLEAFAKIAQDAAKAPLKSADESQPYYLKLDTATGQYVPKIRRLHTQKSIKSVPSLAEFAEHVKECDVWYNLDSVIVRFAEFAIPDALPLRDRLVLALSLSDPMLKLREWDNQRTSLSQNDLAGLLRTKFRGLYTPVSLIDSVSAIDWVNNEKGKSVATQTSRSVSREIETKMDGRINLPEVVAFSVPVWATGGPALTALRVKIECVLETNAATCAFVLTPVGNQVEDQLAWAEGRLGEIVIDNLNKAFGKGGTVPPVFHGSP